MFRKLTTLFLLLISLPCLILTVCAQSQSTVIDEANLLRQEEITYLETVSAQLTDQYSIHAVILTVDSLEGRSAQDVADAYYDNSGFGDNGVLFLLSMAEREWYISTTGSMMYALTDFGIQQIGEHTAAYFADGLWFDGFCCYLTELPIYLDSFESGSPLDGFADYSGDYYHGTQEEILYHEEENSPSLGLSLICGIAAAGITVLIMRSSMNTKQPQRGASAYMNSGSWNLSQHRDLFLYSRVTKTRKQEATTGSKGGGSSVHRSSAGRSHGGGGGKF